MFQSEQQMVKGSPKKKTIEMQYPVTEGIREKTDTKQIYIQMYTTFYIWLNLYLRMFDLRTLVHMNKVVLKLKNSS